MGQSSLAEGVMPDRLVRDERLERIDAAVDWDAVGGGCCRVSAAPATAVRVFRCARW